MSEISFPLLWQSYALRRLPYSFLDSTRPGVHSSHLPKSHIVQYHSFLWAKAHHCIYFDFRTIPDVLEPDEEIWRVYHYKKGVGGFSHLHMSTQDYVYRPFIYQAWRTFVGIRRASRYAEYKKRELKRASQQREDCVKAGVMAHATF